METAAETALIAARSDPTAVEVAQLAGIADRLQQRTDIGLHADGLADVAPERAHAHDQRDDRR